MPDWWDLRRSCMRRPGEALYSLRCMHKGKTLQPLLPRSNLKTLQQGKQRSVSQKYIGSPCQRLRQTVTLRLQTHPGDHNPQDQETFCAMRVKVLPSHDYLWGCSMLMVTMLVRCRRWMTYRRATSVKRGGRGQASGVIVRPTGHPITISCTGIDAGMKAKKTSKRSRQTRIH